MKALLCLPLIATIAAAADVPQGTHVLLRMVNSINTRTCAEGDQVYLTTASPITAGGQILVPTGAYVQGVISHSKRSGMVKGRAELGIRLETLTLPGGKVVKIAPRLDSVDDQKVEKQEGIVKQGSNIGHDAMQIAILAGSGAATGALVDRSWRGAGIGGGIGGGVGIASVLLTRGHEVQLRQGSTLDVIFDRAITIE